MRRRAGAQPSARRARLQQRRPAAVRSSRAWPPPSPAQRRRWRPIRGGGPAAELARRRGRAAARAAPPTFSARGHGACVISKGSTLFWRTRRGARTPRKECCGARVMPRFGRASRGPHLRICAERPPLCLALRQRLACWRQQRLQKFTRCSNAPCPPRRLLRRALCVCNPRAIDGCRAAGYATRKGVQRKVRPTSGQTNQQIGDQRGAAPTASSGKSFAARLHRVQRMAA